MDEITQLVAQNLRKIRDEKKLSLEKLAELTGVSKSMLGQIERGESNPTISIVWKITNGLKISFTSLLNAPREDTIIIHRKNITPLLADDGRYRLFPYYPIAEGRRFEIYTIDIKQFGRHNSDPHPAGTQEFITVYMGELTIRLDEKEYHLGEGDSIRFLADRPHSYQNPGTSKTRLNMVIYYPV